MLIFLSSIRHFALPIKALNSSRVPIVSKRRSAFDTRPSPIRPVVPSSPFPVKNFVINTPFGLSPANYSIIRSGNLHYRLKKVASMKHRFDIRIQTVQRNDACPLNMRIYFFVESGVAFVDRFETIYQEEISAKRSLVL